MRTNLMIALMALALSACASKRDIASTSDENYQEETEQAQVMDAAASSRGNSIR